MVLTWNGQVVVLLDIMLRYERARMRFTVCLLYTSLLDIIGIPYTCSGVWSSALAMDKVKAKVFYERERCV